MAIDKAIDSSALNSNLTSIANAIRTKGGTSAPLAFPAGFVSAIGNIPTGTPVQTYSGTFTTDADGNFTANCGFKPDLVYVYTGTYDYGSVWMAYITIPLFLATDEVNQVYGSSYNENFNFQLFDGYTVAIIAEPLTNGFMGSFTGFDWNWSVLPVANKTVNYTAVKWTA